MFEGWYTSALIRSICYRMTQSPFPPTTPKDREIFTEMRIELAKRQIRKIRNNTRYMKRFGHTSPLSDWVYLEL